MRFPASATPVSGHRGRPAMGRRAGTSKASPWVVGTPGMSSLFRPLVKMRDDRAGWRIQSLERRDKGWHLWFEDQASAGPFDAVAVAAPAAEARLLLGPHRRIGGAAVRDVRMAPCWALDGARSKRRYLPGSGRLFTDVSESHPAGSPATIRSPAAIQPARIIVIHASPSRGVREAEDADPEAVAEELWSEVSHVLGLPPVRPSRMTAHLWRHGTCRSVTRRDTSLLG